jgi:hypothetical protein
MPISAIPVTPGSSGRSPDLGDPEDGREGEVRGPGSGQGHLDSGDDLGVVSPVEAKARCQTESSQRRCALVRRRTRGYVGQLASPPNIGFPGAGENRLIALAWPVATPLCRRRRRTLGKRRNSAWRAEEVQRPQPSSRLRAARPILPLFRAVVRVELTASFAGFPPRLGGLVAPLQRAVGPLAHRLVAAHDMTGALQALHVFPERRAGCRRVVGGQLLAQVPPNQPARHVGEAQGDELQVGQLGQAARARGGWLSSLAGSQDSCPFRFDGVSGSGPPRVGIRRSGQMEHRPDIRAMPWCPAASE